MAEFIGRRGGYSRYLTSLLGDAEPQTTGWFGEGLGGLILFLYHSTLSHYFQELLFLVRLFRSSVPTIVLDLTLGRRFGDESMRRCCLPPMTYTLHHINFGRDLSR